jgi:hypothetical protein
LLVRPDEAKDLQHRDVAIVTDEGSHQKIVEIEVRGKRGAARQSRSGSPSIRMREFLPLVLKGGRSPTAGASHRKIDLTPVLGADRLVIETDRLWGWIFSSRGSARCPAAMSPITR